MKWYRGIACLLALMFLFSGCDNSERLTTLTIVQAVGVDLQQEDTAVAVQYLNLMKNAGSTESLGGNITAVADGRAACLSDAFSDAAKTLSRGMFFGQNKVFVFGKNYAEYQLAQALDYLLRSKDSRPDILLAMSSDTAANIIENKERNARVPAENIADLLRLGEETGLGAAVTVNEILNLYHDETSDIFLPVLEAEGEHVRCSGIAVFSNAMLATVLDTRESFGFLFLKNRIKGGTLSLQSKTLGNTALLIAASKTKLQFDCQTQTLLADIRIKLVLNEATAGIQHRLKQATIQELEYLAAREVETMVRDAADTCYAHQSDPFMTARYAARDDIDYYHAHCANWRETLAQLHCSPHVHVMIQRISSHVE